MIEGDDDSLRRKLDRAKKDPSVSPNLKYVLEKQVKKNEKQQLAKLDRQVARKRNAEAQKKFKEELSKRGVMTADEKQGAKQLMENEQRREEADKAQGGTETPTKAV